MPIAIKAFLVKNIVPKLEAALLHIPINPLNQVKKLQLSSPFPSTKKYPSYSIDKHWQCCGAGRSRPFLAEVC